MSFDDFYRHRERIRSWLLGREYYKAVEALEFASKYHDGFRKDGVTKEFEHQLSIAHYVRTLSNIRNPQATLIVSFLHDLAEDYNVSLKDIELKFGKHVSEAVWLLTKVFNGKKKNIESYFEDMSQNHIASLVKGVDRIHNHQTLTVFTYEKQYNYICETEKYILPMLRAARNEFPDQELAYENIKYSLKGQIEFIKLGIKFYETVNKTSIENEIKI